MNIWAIKSRKDEKLKPADLSQSLTNSAPPPQFKQLSFELLFVGNVSRQIEYWESSAEHDYETMLGLFRIKRYSDSLFFGHIVTEKILKALVVKKTGKQAPRIHNLVVLADLAGLNLSREEKEFLAIANRFNMRTRYPDAKLNFYQLCTQDYTEKNLNKIKQFYKTLCHKLKPKK